MWFYFFTGDKPNIDIAASVFSRQQVYPTSIQSVEGEKEAPVWNIGRRREIFIFLFLAVTLEHFVLSTWKVAASLIWRILEYLTLYCKVFFSPSFLHLVFLCVSVLFFDYSIASSLPPSCHQTLAEIKLAIREAPQNGWLSITQRKKITLCRSTIFPRSSMSFIFFICLSTFM